MAGVDELACTYASLILHDSGIDITSDALTTLIGAANVQVEGYWPTLFAGALGDAENLENLIISGLAAAGGAGASADAGAQGGEAVEAEVEEEKEPTEESSSEGEMGFSFFGSESSSY
eukprot:TRINITY_DN12057_c0_g1_i1.p1 TRINITY_DN12057_c0_g1~~TRINITY_DN12057_c0_g1_i1.p1  ORF type:complete len:118 (+),score=64.07 TRINITY_DN12057_c0_g1_i1:54-407(+)